MLCARIKENGLENILKAIDKIKDSDFLQGKNNKGWAITFDWFVLPNNFIKVYEGNYNNRPTVEVKPKGIFNNYEQKIYSEGELEEILRRKGIR